MSLWDSGQAAPPLPSNWDDTPKTDAKKRPPPRKMARGVPLPGPVCPDCLGPLLLEEGRGDAPYCMGCAPDPGYVVHYVSEYYLNLRTQRRARAAAAMTAMAAAYRAPRPTQTERDLIDFLTYDVVAEPIDPDMIEPETGDGEISLDDLPL